MWHPRRTDYSGLGGDQTCDGDEPRALQERDREQGKHQARRERHRLVHYGDQTVGSLTASHILHTPYSVQCQMPAPRRANLSARLALALGVLCHRSRAAGQARLGERSPGDSGKACVDLTVHSALDLGE